MSNTPTSPHERMLAYLREGERLVPPAVSGVPDWSARYVTMSAAAAEPTTAAAHSPESPDLSPEAWYRDSLDEAALGRSVVRW
ncbi:hypothetical protein ACFC0M_16450 [Streptomyces sp. NPDC056149]|uniref:hypothetical protein n=1 Tax=unclassified Streptomyces TaxID=2593676 RepID=UPI002380E36B|nr:hypothetical protein [Streptomyces sp. WZ-12]